MLDLKIFNTADFVLKVSQHYDITRLDLSAWDRFLDILCQDREYQKQAIKTSIIYLFSGKYQSIENLAKENYQKNEFLQERYKNLDDYLKKLQLANKLSANIDLATGTGKSYVMYGIAQIALGIGLIDKVLVLCPSLTIEKGLTEKFKELSVNPTLKNAIPTSAKYKNPRIIDATQTIQDGDICIENIHAVYVKNNSSITDSLGFGKGATCLVLSDEAHHIYNKISGNDTESKGLKKWKEFLLDTTFHFRYMLGFTGTAYIENEYFNDVIFRYSLKSAIEDKIVKTVFYVAKDEQTQEKDEKFQKIYKNHQDNKAKYNKIKPLTILITATIQEAERLKTDLCEFLAKRENLSEEYIRQNQVLIITSKHKENTEVYLPNVDKIDNTFEWIVSVSMLTEGWDVKNVFQIVPMEERAFNSKLLISQVLGRGLRLMPEYPQAQVLVFNHDNWTSKIQKLVDEILEIEMKLIASVLKNEQERSKYHFTLYNINYDKQPTEIPTTETKTFDYTKDFIELTAQVEEYEVKTDYVNTGSGIKEITYKIEKEMFSIVEIVNRIYEEFKVREWEGITLKLKDGEYTKNNLPAKETLLRIIQNSMEKREIKGEFLDKRNKQAVLNSFNTLLRKKSKSIIYTKKINQLLEIHTINREIESLSVSNLRKDSTVFFAEWEKDIENEDAKIVMREIIENSNLPRKATAEINPFCFKTCTDLVFTSSEPERKFVENLCKLENAKLIKSWFKSKNQGFYEIEYSITTDAGKHSKLAKFNPDFFIVLEKENTEYVIVVEIKSNGDINPENKAKLKYATQHFVDLNSTLTENNIPQKYVFHFLSPSDYAEFFAYLQDGKLVNNKFLGELERELQE